MSATDTPTTSAPSEGATRAASELRSLLADNTIIIVNRERAVYLLALTIQDLTDGVERGTARSIATTIAGLAQRAKSPTLEAFGMAIADVVRGAFEVSEPAHADDGEGGDGEGTSK